MRDLELRFHWHWATTGASVSPHCDNRRKLGSHIFYLNTDADWQPQWGGETVVLGDGGRFRRSSAPDFGDFDAAHPAVATGNRSLVFTRRGNSWHGVREIRCPEGAFRKVFIVVLNRPRLGPRIRRVVGRRPAPERVAESQPDARRATRGEGLPAQVTQSWWMARVAPTWRRRRFAGVSGKLAASTSISTT